MFVKRNKNRSGSISIQVLQKQGRSNRLVRTFGTSTDEQILQRWEIEAKAWAEEQTNGPSLFENEGMETVKCASDYDAIFSSIAQNDLTLVGPELVYGRLYDKIGFNNIHTSDNELFKSLVVTRLYKPGSKLRTREYLHYFMNKYYDEDRIYRYLDELCRRKTSGMSEKELYEAERKSVKYQIEQITYEQTRRVLGGQVSVVFYDTTTMYFESREDDMRVPGWSKDGKSSNPQVVLGLLVASGGNPIGYEIHKGNQYEGDTLLPIISKLQKRFAFEKPIVIADAGLLNKKNIKDLEIQGYEYILGARIKSMSEDMKAKVLSLNLGNGDSGSIKLTTDRRMVVTMSDSRAKKNAADRSKGLSRLEKRFKRGTFTKDKINSRGYNKFLSIEGDATVSIDYSKVEYDARFDGLKGYTTNSKLSDKEIVENYKYLFMIERAFRFNKTDLDIRPMYHRLFNRIEAHVCICFIAYTIMLELERLLKDAKSLITLDRARFLTEKIYQISYVNPYNNQRKSVLIKSEHDSEVNELLTIISDACQK